MWIACELWFSNIMPMFRYLVIVRFVYVFSLSLNCWCLTVCWFPGFVVLLCKWSATTVNSQAPEGQPSNVPATVANGQPVSNTAVPATQLDRQMNGSRFNPDKNRELQKLPLLKGDGPYCCTFLCFLKCHRIAYSLELYTALCIRLNFWCLSYLMNVYHVVLIIWTLCLHGHPLLGYNQRAFRVLRIERWHVCQIMKVDRYYLALSCFTVNWIYLSIISYHRESLHFLAIFFLMIPYDMRRFQVHSKTN